MRPDGYSIHRTRDDLKRYLADYWAAERKRNPSGVVPDEYSRADGSPYEAIVDDATHASLEGKHGVRVYNNNTPDVAVMTDGFR